MLSVQAVSYSKCIGLYHADLANLLWCVVSSLVEYNGI